MKVNSATRVANLNADRVDNLSPSDFSRIATGTMVFSWRLDHSGRRVALIRTQPLKPSLPVFCDAATVIRKPFT